MCPTRSGEALTRDPNPGVFTTLCRACSLALRLRRNRSMSPGGHLVTTAIAGGVSLAATGSVTFAAGIAVGGFLIDVDHIVDYVTVERQRALTPPAFLRHYTEGRTRRFVLALHSYELFLALALLAGWLESPTLAGYLAGGAMHLALDIVFNGRLTPKNIFAFYSFGYRLSHRFDAEALFGAEPLDAPAGFWRSFYFGARPRRPESLRQDDPGREIELHPLVQHRIASDRGHAVQLEDR